MAKKSKKKSKGKVQAADILLAPFLPLVGIAKKIYRKRTGKEPPKKPKDLLLAFYRDVMKRKYDYDLEPATIGMIVGAVVSFITDLIKKSKEKKKKGEQLTQEEQEMANSNAD
ncbi:MAG: hypothetical protein N3E49_09585, partial [Bacteroidia bacterium]|nr:hypothetical protein [Bacteroidia bacterium]